jgi:hypothetical protein
MFDSGINGLVRLGKRSWGSYQNNEQNDAEQQNDSNLINLSSSDCSVRKKIFVQSTLSFSLFSSSGVEKDKKLEKTKKSTKKGKSIKPSNNKVLTLPQLLSARVNSLAPLLNTGEKDKKAENKQNSKLMEIPLSPAECHELVLSDEDDEQRRLVSADKKSQKSNGKNKEKSFANKQKKKKNFQTPPSPARSPNITSEELSPSQTPRSSASFSCSSSSSSRSSCLSFPLSQFSSFACASASDQQFYTSLSIFRQFRHFNQEKKDQILHSEAKREAAAFKKLKPLWKLIQSELDQLIDTSLVINPMTFRELILAFHHCDKGGRLRRLCLLEPQFLLFILHSVRRIRFGPNHSPARRHSSQSQVKYVIPPSSKTILDQINQLESEEDDEEFSPEEDDSDEELSIQSSKSLIEGSTRSTRSSIANSISSKVRAKRTRVTTRSLASTESCSDSSQPNSPVHSRPKNSKVSRDGRPVEFQSTGVSYKLSESYSTSAECRSWIHNQIHSRDDYHMFLSVLVYMSIISIADDEHIGNLKKTIFFSALITKAEYGEKENSRRLRASTAKKSHGNEMMYKFDAMSLELIQRDFLTPLPIPIISELDAKQQ